MNWLDVLGPLTRHRDRRNPLYARIESRIRESIQSGRLTEGERLPADREMAQLLKVDRSTIARAYDELEAAGLVTSQVGRGTFVAQRGAAAEGSATGSARRAAASGDGLCQLVWAESFSRASQMTSSIVARQVTPPISGGDTISFAGGIPTQEFFPHKDFQRIVSSLLCSERSLEMFGYSPPEGHQSLRAEVRKHLSRQGIFAQDDEILILSGSQQGIDLLARTLVDPGDVVLMEDPSYFLAICNFAALGARLIPVPMDEDGLRLDVLDGIMSRQRAKLLYVMPSFQNPTGATLTSGKREELLRLARFHQVAILEDNFVGDLSFESGQLPSLRSLDPSGGTVIYQGTLSKALCPGLRLGWMVAPRQVMARLRLAKRSCDLSTNSMAQVVAAEYLREGLYEKHLLHVTEAYRQRRDVLCQALESHLGDYLSFSKPRGGMFVFGKLPEGYSSRELLSLAEKEGVSFSPGDMFFLGNDRFEFLRLSFIQLKKGEIEEGVRRLGAAVRAYAARARRSSRAATGSCGAEGTFI